MHHVKKLYKSSCGILITTSVFSQLSLQVMSLDERLYGHDMNVESIKSKLSISSLTRLPHISQIAKGGIRQEKYHTPFIFTVLAHVIFK